MAELFGFSITRQKKTADPKQSFTQPQADDGTQTIAAGWLFWPIPRHGRERLRQSKTLSEDTEK
jgi:hypothetical protein